MDPAAAYDKIYLDYLARLRQREANSRQLADDLAREAAVLRQQTSTLELQAANAREIQETTTRTLASLEQDVDDEDALAIAILNSMEDNHPATVRVSPFELERAREREQAEERERARERELARERERAKEREQAEERERAEERKQAEEAATRAVFRGVDRYTLLAQPAGSGRLQIGGVELDRKECGSVSGAHSNLCGYLSLANGNGGAAIWLKEDLAPLATKIARDLGRSVDFSGVATMAENEVFMAYVLRKKIAVCVYNSAANVAEVYHTPECGGQMVYLHCDGGHHFQRLTRV